MVKKWLKKGSKYPLIGQKGQKGLMGRGPQTGGGRFLTAGKLRGLQAFLTFPRFAEK